MPVATRITPASRKVLPPTQVEVTGIATVQTPEPRLEILLPRVPPSMPLKVVLLLSAPRPGLRALVPVTVNVPAPAREPTESLPAISQLAPAKITTGTSGSRLELPPPSTTPPLTNFPAAIITGPVNVEPAVRVRVPAPDLVKPPGPEMTPSKLKIVAAVGTSKLALPPGR